MDYVSLFISASLITNIVLSSFLGICPLIGVSNKTSSAIGMSAAVAFVTIVSSIVTALLFHLVLVPFDLEFMRTIVFILIIASLVQFVEMVMKKYMPPLYKALGVFLPLIVTNCAILGAALINIDRGYNMMETIVYSVAVSVGFGIVMFIFATLRERLAASKTPGGFGGVPIAFVAVAIMAMAFFGFAGMA